ncbi:MAG: ABC transporter permease [Lachnospiraceae bacterium]|nr:ABC transporter permease [Lachnospiraceae bacterium]
MKKYWAFFRLRFSMGLQYRVAAAAGIVTQFFWGGMNILVYRAFYETDAEAFPMSFQATSTYIWLQQAFLALFAAWMVENEIFENIMNGNVAYEMCRPVSIYNMWFSRSMANRLARALLRCFPVLLFAAFLPAPFGIGKPASMGHLGLFLVAMFLGFGVTVAFFMMIYGLTFFTISPNGLRILISSVVEFLAGAIIPLPFFPDKIRTVLELLPFASMQNVPLRVYSGSMSGEEMIKGILLQAVWLVVLVIIGKVLLAFAEKKIVVQGG